jgi:isoquinoline 1-oxidoreductase beta subunit
VGRWCCRTACAPRSEGSVIHALSTALGEKVEIAQDRAVNTNFDGYAVLRIGEAPAVIESHLIESGERMGEPPVPPITPAVANAVSVLLGRRIRRMPLPDEMRA